MGSVWDVGVLWDLEDIWGSVLITGATGLSCAVHGREAGWYRHSSPQNPPLTSLSHKIYTVKGLHLFLLLDFAPVSASRGKFPGQLVGNGKMEEK